MLRHKNLFNWRSPGGSDAIANALVCFSLFIISVIVRTNTFDLSLYDFIPSLLCLYDQTTKHIYIYIETNEKQKPTTHQFSFSQSIPYSRMDFHCMSRSTFWYLKIVLNRSSFGNTIHFIFCDKKNLNSCENYSATQWHKSQKKFSTAI